MVFDPQVALVPNDLHAGRLSERYLGWALVRSTAVKTCPRCGRDFEWRAKWASHWEDVRYCSERCRRRRLGKTDRAL
ncbi:MAG: DUF2256 domain-containing protein, partial [Myxococcota bacterium]